MSHRSAPGEPLRGDLPGIQAMRGIAALLVIVVHAFVYSGGARSVGTLLGSAIDGGYTMVDVFFVISALVLFLPVATTGGVGPVGAYALRRAARVLPTYWVVMVVAALLIPWVTSARPPLPPSAEGWVFAAQSLLPLHALVVSGPHYAWLGYGSASTVWTLSIELVFYVSLPLIGRWFLRHPVRGLVIAFLLSRANGLVALAWPALHRAVGNPLPASELGTSVDRAVTFPTAFCLHFAVGMALAIALTDDRSRAALRRHARALAVIGTGGLTAVWLSLGAVWWHQGEYPRGAATVWHSSGTFPLLVCLAAAVPGLVLLPDHLRRVYDNPVTRWLGAVSYPVYLCHMVFISFTATTLGVRHDGRVSSFLELLATVPLSYLVAASLHVWIEAPAIRAARRASRRLGGTARDLRRGPRWRPHSGPSPDVRWPRQQRGRRVRERAPFRHPLALIRRSGSRPRVTAKARVPLTTSDTHASMRTNPVVRSTDDRIQ